MCIEYHMQVNMYYVSAQGVDERAINVHYYYLLLLRVIVTRMSIDERVSDVGIIEQKRLLPLSTSVSLTRSSDAIWSKQRVRLEETVSE